MHERLAALRPRQSMALHLRRTRSLLRVAAPLGGSYGEKHSVASVFGLRAEPHRRNPREIPHGRVRRFPNGRAPALKGLTLKTNP